MLPIEHGRFSKKPTLWVTILSRGDATSMSNTHRYSLTARLVLDFAATRFKDLQPACHATAQVHQRRRASYEPTVSLTRLRTGLLRFRREPHGIPPRPEQVRMINMLNTSGSELQHGSRRLKLKVVLYKGSSCCWTANVVVVEGSINSRSSLILRMQCTVHLMNGDLH